MSRSIRVCAIVLAAAGGVAAEKPATAAEKPAGVETLAWMAGAWSGEKDGVAMEEVWTDVRGGALLGLHRDVEGGRMASFEFLRIQAADGGVFYYASPRGAPPTAFKLVESGSRRAVFENPQHNFPRRILYWLDVAGALHARIEGPRDGKTVGEEWVWRKAR